MFRTPAVIIRSTRLRPGAALIPVRAFHYTHPQNVPRPRSSKPVEAPSAISEPPRKRGRPRKSAADGENGVGATPKKSKGARRSSAGTVDEIITRQKEQRVFVKDQGEIVSYLDNLIGGGNKRKIKGDNKRINIVSEKLCDDILERLKPSLAEHMGCDIIDINPGAGLWSSKLHNALKPRTHVMMEPEETVYRPLLQPLLDAKGSTYKLIPKSGVVWAHLEKLLTKEYLPYQEAPGTHEGGIRKRNKTLLVTANIGYYPKKPYRGFKSLAVLLMYQFLSAARAQSLFHHYGVVRMLIWVMDEERNTALPKNLSLRRKAAIEAEVTCEKLEEVASSTYADFSWRRDRSIDIKSTMAVLKRMKEAGIETPGGRESLTALEITTSGSEIKDLTGHELPLVFFEEFEMLKAGFAEGKYKEYQDELSPGRRKAPTKEFARLRELTNKKTFYDSKAEKMIDLMTENDRIMELQKEIYNSQDDTAALKEQLKERTQEWKERVNLMGNQDQGNLDHQLENHRSFHFNPPLLQWDRRDYEPLRVHPDEFYPQHEMALLDYQPQPLWPILSANFPANYDVLEYILSSLLIVPTATVRKGFNALWPGAFEWLVAECPSLTDPNKGGNMDIDLMYVKSLTLEMYKEIIEAWLRWPWRPSRHDLMVRSGSSATEHDDLDD